MVHLHDSRTAARRYARAHAMVVSCWNETDKDGHTTAHSVMWNGSHYIDSGAALSCATVALTTTQGE